MLSQIFRIGKLVVSKCKSGCLENPVTDDAIKIPSKTVLKMRMNPDASPKKVSL